MTFKKARGITARFPTEPGWFAKDVGIAERQGQQRENAN